MTRIGVDIGGTFTDLIWYDDASGRIEVAKRPTTPDALEDGVLAAVGQALSAEETSAAELFLHGTTVGLNTLLQSSGARTGLICTRGFRDVLEIGRGDRPVMYDMFWKRPTPLVARRYRLPVRERVAADGSVLVRLDEDDVLDAVSTLVAAEIEAIAVCLMNSYKNPVHELWIEEIIRSTGFAGGISLSHRLSREYREFERTSTTVIDAYIRPVTSRYLERLSGGLATSTFSGEVLVTRSGGGVMTAEEFEARPFEGIQSGPVAGVEAAAELCRTQGWPLAITADVGGTSFDTALIVDGRPEVKHEGAIMGWPLQTPWIDVRSIGAGGGSIAYEDNGLLRVGPQSAGSVPGPACYGRGGDAPTTTDAALLLGMLGDGALGDALTLDVKPAEAAIGELAHELNLTMEATARGIVTIAAAAMAETIREITIGQGHDPREARLLAFGGAGPVFAALVAMELQIQTIIVPAIAGNFSAWGLLGQDVTTEAARTIFRVFDSNVVERLNADMAEMFEELEERNRGQGDRVLPAGELVLGLDLRYVGQEHTLTIRKAVGTGALSGADIESLQRDFESAYERRFGTTLDESLELVTLRATSRRRLPQRFPDGARRLTAPQLASSQGTDARSKLAYSFTCQERVPFKMIDRERLPVGEVTAGPAILPEPTATTYVDVGSTFHVDAAGSLVVDRSGGAE